MNKGEFINGRRRILQKKKIQKPPMAISIVWNSFGKTFFVESSPHLVYNCWGVFYKKKLQISQTLMARALRAVALEPCRAMPGTTRHGLAMSARTVGLNGMDGPTRHCHAGLGHRLERHGPKPCRHARPDLSCHRQVVPGTCLACSADRTTHLPLIQ